MSVVDGPSGTTGSASRSGGVFIFLPLLIAVLGVGAIWLGQLSERAAAPIGLSSYGIDERVTGAVIPAGEPPIIDLRR